MSSFAENLRGLPGISHLVALQLLDEEGRIEAVIENRPGQAGSLTVYNHLAQIFGAITPQAAAHGLDLYAEHTEEARAKPGHHPNIDRLLALVEQRRTLRIKHVFAV
ncbi:MAG: DUF2322 family protein [Betaproteobacteria bacterium]|nr:DUF2322 family protein [Betaproteobacteria bacterium]